ncbi:MFS transporter [Paenibacillus jiagnxiensis]|uniref:MFS transporter n=1 Tax=Paenibacillus jiagnxiensis TaxID=3228926 RepID=UPI0033A8E5C3
MQKNWKKNAGIFIASQAISLFGSSLVQFAITWYVTLKTQSGIYATLTIICGFLPTFLLSPFAGVWADRYDRKKLIMLSDGGIATCTLVLAILFLTGHDSIWLLFVASVIRALGAAIQTPSVNALLPDIIPNEHLTRIGGINSSIQSLITLLSPMASGALMGFASIESIFFIDVTTAAIAIISMLVFFKLPKQEKKVDIAKAPDYMGDLKEGLSYIFRNRYLRNVFVFFAAFDFLAAPMELLTPLQITRTFGSDVWRLTAIEMTYSVGVLAGGIVIAVWGGLKNKVHTMALAGLIMGITTIGIGLPINFGLYLLFMVLCGVSANIFYTPAVVLLQEKVEPEYRGRVFGIITMMTSSLTPLGMLLYGPLADVVSIEWLLLATGALVLIMTCALRLNKALLKAGESGTTFQK